MIKFKDWDLMNIYFLKCFFSASKNSEGFLLNIIWILEPQLRVEKSSFWKHRP